MKVTWRELLMVGGAVVAFAVQWGMFDARLAAQEVKTKDINQISVILSRLDGIVESQNEIKKDVRELRQAISIRQP